MTSFSEQLSAVRTSQWEAQLDMFRRLSDRALESTEQLIALNIRTSRRSMEQAAGAVKQLLEASDPRDLIAVGSAAQGQLHQMFAYGRELLGIATGMRSTWSTLPAALSPAPLQLAAAKPAAAPALAPQSDTLEQAEASFEATVETAIADAVPPAEPTPLAKALNEAAPKPASALRPIASTVPLEALDAIESGAAPELPAVAPVEHTPPIQAPAREGKPPRASRKK